MAKPIYSMEHLTTIEAPVQSRPTISHTQAKPQPQTAVTLCASCKHQSGDNFDVCNNSAWEGGPVGKVFVMWKCSGWQKRTD